jgi:hypothetical protein
MSSTQEVGEIFGAGSGPAHAMLRSPTVLIASIGLWGMNVFFFRVFGIDYVKVLKHDLLKMEGSDDAQDQFLHPIVTKGSTDVDQSEKESLSEHGENNTDLNDDGDWEDDVSEPVVGPNSISWARLVGLSMMLLFILHSACKWALTMNGAMNMEMTMLLKSVLYSRRLLVD